MSRYTGQTVSVPASPEQISAKFADLSLMQDMVDEMPEAERQRVGDVKFTKDSIIIQAPAVGQLAFTVVERTDRTVRFEASQPMPMALFIDMEPEGEGSRVTSGIDIELPAMLKPFVGPQLQKAAEQMGALMTRLAR